MGWFDSKKPTPEEIKAAQERLRKKGEEKPAIEMRRGNTGLNKELFTDEEIAKKNKEKR